jgi:hypothetical protein
MHMLPAVDGDVGAGHEGGLRAKQEAAGAQNANRLMSTGNFGAPGRI